MNLTLRDATADDAALFEQMTIEGETYFRKLEGKSLSADDHKPWGEIFLREAFGEAPCFSCRIAELDGEAAGFFSYYIGYDADHALRTLFLADVFVRPGARRRGVGRALLTDAARRARALNAGMIRWLVWSKNPDAVAFYEALGAIVDRAEYPSYWPAARWPVA